MNLDNETKNSAALELTGKIVANPDLAGPILKILEQLGGDVKKLNSVDLSALKSARGSSKESALYRKDSTRRKPNPRQS